MLSYETSYKLAHFLTEISQAEQEIESNRQNLCTYRNFEPYALYKIIEGSQGNISSADIRTFLAENNIYHNQNDCDIFIKKYSINQHSRITYCEYLRFVLPSDSPLLRAITTQRPNYRASNKNPVDAELLRALAKLIDNNISLYLNLDVLKAKLFSQKDFSYESAFGAIDRFSTSRVDYDNLKYFLEGRALYLEPKDLIAVIRFFNKGPKDYFIFSEFVDEITPAVNNTYEYYLNDNLQNLDKLCGITPFYRGSVVEIVSKSIAKQVPVENEQGSVLVSSALTAATSAADTKEIGLKDNFGDSFGKNTFMSTAANTFTEGRKPINIQDSNVQDHAMHRDDLNEEVHVNSQRSDLIMGFIDFLQRIVAFTKELDIAKEELLLKEDFNVTDLFSKLKPDENGFLNDKKLEEGVINYGVKPRDNEISLLVKRYDKDFDQKLKLNDLVEMLTPVLCEELMFIKLRPLSLSSSRNFEDLFSTDTKVKINRVFSLLLEYEAIFHYAKTRLIGVNEVNIKTLFDHFDTNSSGYITNHKLKEELEDKDWFATNNELKLIMSIFDHNKDSKVSFSEFLQQLSYV